MKQVVVLAISAVVLSILALRAEPIPHPCVKLAGAMPLYGDCR